MDDATAQQVLKQLRFLNRWIKLMTALFVLSLLVAGVVIYKVVTFAQDAASKVDNLQKQASQTLNVKQQICNSESISTIIKKQSGYCN